MSDLPPLPMPWDYCYEWDGPFGTRKFSSARWNDSAPTRSVALFTADQLSAYGAACAQAEREACAKLADEYATWGGSNFASWFHKLASAIRARGEA